MKVIFLIPAYNEEKTIGKIIENCHQFGDVLVVNDGSDDQTTDIVLASKARLIEHKFNLGYSSALLTGLRSINQKYDMICVIDADGEIPANLFHDYLKSSQKKHFLIGNRLNKNRLVEVVISMLVRLNLEIRDPLCGGFAISNELNRNTLERLNAVPIDCCFFSYKFIASKYADKIVNVTFKPEQRSDSSRFGSGFLVQMKIFFDFIRAAYRVSNS